MSVIAMEVVVLGGVVGCIMVSIFCRSKDVISNANLVPKNKCGIISFVLLRKTSLDSASCIAAVHFRVLYSSIVEYCWCASLHDAAKASAEFSCGGANVFFNRGVLSGVRDLKVEFVVDEVGVIGGQYLNCFIVSCLCVRVLQYTTYIIITCREYEHYYVLLAQNINRIQNQNRIAYLGTISIFPDSSIDD